MARKKHESEARQRAYPLDKLPAEMQERIQQEVAQPYPPERWRTYALCQMESRAWYEWYWQRGWLAPGEAGSRPSISPTLRAQVIARDGYICGICRLPVEPTDVHLDHIQPWSKGGKHRLENLRVTHSLCNMRKGARI